MATDYQIGSTQESMLSLTELTTPIPEEHRPRSTWEEEVIRLGSGHVRSLGYPVVIWNFPKLTVEQRDQLHEFCSDGYSSEVFIKTSIYDNSDEEKIFRAIMEWPRGEDRKAGFRFEFQIKFSILEEISEGPSS